LVCVCVGGLAAWKLTLRAESVTLSLLVTGYTLYLAWGQAKLGWSLGESTRESPYYLGFLLTQIALAAIFARITQQDGTAADVIGLLAPRLASALMTSVFGLLGRHVLVSMDPLASDHRAAQDSLRLQLQGNLQRFSEIQQKFEEFIAALSQQRKAFLADEQNAAQRLGDTLKSLIAGIKTADQELLRSIQQLSTHLQGLSTDLNSKRTDTVAALQHTYESVSRVLKEIDASISEFGSSAKTFATSAAGIAELSRAIHEAAGQTAAFGNANQDSARTLGRVSESMEGVHRTSESFTERYRSLEVVLDQFVHKAEDRIRQMERATDRVHALSEKLAGGL